MNYYKYNIINDNIYRIIHNQIVVCLFLLANKNQITNLMCYCGHFHNKLRMNLDFSKIYGRFFPITYPDRFSLFLEFVRRIDDKMNIGSLTHQKYQKYQQINEITVRDLFLYTADKLLNE